jgi:predicted Fe-Mo cluster-binding NifX family protein
VLPHWLAGQGADMIIAGGMGMRAQNLFEEQNVKVVTGAQPETPETLATAYLAGSLETGINACDH